MIWNKQYTIVLLGVFAVAFAIRLLVWQINEKRLAKLTQNTPL